MIAVISVRFFVHMIWIMGLYVLFNTTSNRIESVEYYTVPLIILIVLAIIYWHLNSVYSFLVPEPKDPELINFQVDIDIRDPFDHIGNIPLPPYLDDFEEEKHQRRDNGENGENDEDEDINASDESDRIIAGDNREAPLDSVINVNREQR